MILTGKAKEDFLEYLDVEEKWFNEEYRPLFEYALIIEWFDSFSITVDVIPRINDENEIVFEPNTFSAKYNITTTDDFDNLKTRQESTRQAIIKANEIYNSKN